MANARSNPFVRQIYFWWLIAPILSSLLFPALLSSESMKVQPQELAFAEQCGRAVDQVTESATGAFNTLFVDTGILRRTLSGSEQAESTGWAGYAWMGSTFHGYISRFWQFAYRVVWRWTAFWPFYVSGVLGIAAPCLVDGLITRAKKRYRFGQYNPLAFNVGGTLFAMAIGWLLYVPLLPIPLTIVVMGGFFLLLGVFAWFTTANFQRFA